MAARHGLASVVVNNKYDILNRFDTNISTICHEGLLRFNINVWLNEKINFETIVKHY